MTYLNSSKRRSVKPVGGGFTLHPRVFSLRQGGFTLIELLVVIAIIGILSSVVLVSLGKARKKGKYAHAVSTLKNVELAIYQALDDEGATEYWKTYSTSGNPCGSEIRLLSDIITDSVCLNDQNNYPNSLSEYLSSAPKMKIGGDRKQLAYYRYSNGSGSCDGGASRGPVLWWGNYASADSADFDALNKMIDGDNESDGDPNTSDDSWRCGKLRYETWSGGAHVIMYQLNPTSDF